MRLVLVAHHPYLPLDQVSLLPPVQQRIAVVGVPLLNECGQGFTCGYLVQPGFAEQDAVGHQLAVDLLLLAPAGIHGGLIFLL